jgi:hypothetical protein
LELVSKEGNRWTLRHDGVVFTVARIGDDYVPSIGWHSVSQLTNQDIELTVYSVMDLIEPLERGNDE